MKFLLKYYYSWQDNILEFASGYALSLLYRFNKDIVSKVHNPFKVSYEFIGHEQTLLIKVAEGCGLMLLKQDVQLLNELPSHVLQVGWQNSILISILPIKRA